MLQSISVYSHLIIISGQLIRIAATVTAKNNFTHTISLKKLSSHELVTHGIYSVVRHPGSFQRFSFLRPFNDVYVPETSIGYSGFFLWAIGIQLLLGNIICLIAFLGILWVFFSVRIRFEENILSCFFGDRYLQYRQSVPFSGVPLSTKLSLEGFLSENLKTAMVT